MLIRFICLVLAMTALLKLWVLQTDPFADIKLGYPTWMLWAAVIWELSVCFAIGCLGVKDIRSFFICLTTFLVFLTVSVTRSALGFESCGCAGAIDIPIWAMCCFNGLILTGLLVQHQVTKSFTRTEATFPFSGIAGILIAVVGFAVFQNQVAIPGEIMVSAKPIRLGDLALKEMVDVEVEIQNHSESTFEIVGHNSSCQCLNAGNERVVLQPGANAILEITVKPSETGFFWQRVYYLLDLPQQQRVAVDLVGFVPEGV